MMAKRLFKIHAVPDLLVSSPANRASSTATLFGAEWGIKPEEILYKPELYHAEASVFNKVISAIDPLYNTIAIFSHNPGITEFVNQLTPKAIRLDNMPTSAVFGVQVDSKTWVDFQEAAKTFWFLDYPKALKPQFGA
jgi:phosphohistidine phosphatase